MKLLSLALLLCASFALTGCDQHGGDKKDAAKPEMKEEKKDEPKKEEAKAEVKEEKKDDVKKEGEHKEEAKPASMMSSNEQMSSAMPSTNNETGKGDAGKNEATPISVMGESTNKEHSSGKESN